MAAIAATASLAQPIEWNQKNADQAQQLDRVLIDMRSCLDSGIRLGLRVHIRDQAKLADFTMKMCAAPFSIYLQRHGMAEDAAVETIARAFGEELAFIQQLGH